MLLLLLLLLNFSLLKIHVLVPGVGQLQTLLQPVATGFGIRGCQPAWARDPLWQDHARDALPVRLAVLPLLPLLPLALGLGRARRL